MKSSRLRPRSAAVLLALLLPTAAWSIAGERRPAAAPSPPPVSLVPDELRATALTAPPHADAGERRVTRESASASESVSAPFRRGARGRLHGRVVTEDGAPLEGFAVELRRRNEAVAGVVTDRAGRFAFDVPGPTGFHVRVDDRPGWSVDERVRWPSDAEYSGREPLVVTAQRLVAAPVRGIVVDTETGEPVEGFAVRVRGPSRRKVYARTGADGRFETSLPIASGDVEVRSEDGPLVNGPKYRRIVPHLVAGGPAADVVLEAEIGPAFQLDLDGSYDRALDGLRAVLGDERSPDRPVILAERPWVRFPPLPTWEQKRFLGLMLRTDDGFVAGRARVPAMPPPTEPVRVVLEETAVLEVRVADDVPAGLGIEAVEAHGRKRMAGMDPVLPPGARTVRLQWVAPGPHTARLTWSDRTVTHHHVDLVASEVAVLVAER